MSSILQELTLGPASPTASRCPQMALEEDAGDTTFSAVQEHGLKYHRVNKDWPCDFNRMIAAAVATAPLLRTQPARGCPRNW